jgi:hypothetical protein
MDIKIKLDSSGFPMIWVQPIRAYMHWLPVTKIQIEHFLSSTNDAMFDEAWYNRLLSMNKRISPGEVRNSNYWEAFLTGILPREAQRFAIWCGRDYDLPTADEWFAAYKHFKSYNQDSSVIENIALTPGLSERAQTLLANVESAARREAASALGSERTLADQMLMRLGLMEYVYEDEQRNTFGGFGQTHSAFFGSFVSPNSGVQRLNNPAEGARMRQYGFRLIYRGV